MSVIGSIISGSPSAFAGDVTGVNAGRANQPISSYQPITFTSPGLSANYNGDSITLNRSSGINSNLTGLSGAFANQATELGALRSQLAPGFGAITQSALAGLENRRRAAIGNLRENLQRRRVLGSSFASDALSRAEAEFSQQESEIRAEAKLKEVALQNELINQQAQARAQQFQTFLDQFNFEAQLATQLSTGVSAIMAENARAQAEVNSNSQMANADFLSGMIGLGFGALTGAPA